jgi:hypothetical protein
MISYFFKKSNVTHTNEYNLKLFESDYVKDDFYPIIEEIAKTNDLNSITNAFIQCFHERNYLEGNGNRYNSYHLFLELYQFYPQYCCDTVHLFAHYGYWKDLINILELLKINEKNLPLINKIIQIYGDQLKIDKESKSNISYAGKWAPRENHKFHKNYKQLFNMLLEYLFPNLEKNAKKKEYRNLISKLNKRLKTTEIYMCANEWSKIDFDLVPKIHLSKWHKAHLNVDLKQIPSWENFHIGNRCLSNVDRIQTRQNLLNWFNTRSNYYDIQGKLPHEIINILKNNDVLFNEKVMLDHQWEQYQKRLTKKYLPLCYFYDSDIANSLTILLSNDIIVPDEEPYIFSLSEDELIDKIEELNNIEWVSSGIDLEKIYNLVSKNYEELPTVVIFSDCPSPEHNFDKEVNFNLIHWNLKGNCKKPIFENNMIKLNGFSKKLLDFFIDNKEIPTNEEYFLSIVNSEEYNLVRDLIN